MKCLYFCLIVSLLAPCHASEIGSLDPLDDGISSLKLIRYSGSDLDIVNAARVSYRGYSESLTPRDEKLISYLLKNRHMSPFEHNQLSFYVKAPLYVARQWMRHRINSYNEISYRYVESSLEFYLPKTWRYQDKKSRQSSYGGFESVELDEIYQQALDQASISYQKLLDAGVCREQARGVLPMCTYTEFIMTCNLRALLHFLSLRLDPLAQYEIRVFAEGILQLTEPLFPLTIAAYKQYGSA